MLLGNLLLDDGCSDKLGLDDGLCFLSQHLGGLPLLLEDLSMRFVNYRLVQLVDYLLVPFVDYWLMNLMNLLFVDHRLMMFMYHILVMFVDDVSVHFLDYGRHGVRLDPCGHGVPLDDGALDVPLDHRRLLMPDDRRLHVLLLDDGLLLDDALLRLDCGRLHHRHVVHLDHRPVDHLRHRDHLDASDHLLLGVRHALGHGNAACYRLERHLMNLR